MRVYHGTDSRSAHNIIENGVDLKCGEKSVDNALGFYTTPNRDFAIRRAIMKTGSLNMFNNKKRFDAVVLEIEVNEDAFRNLSVKEFENTNFYWKEFVFYNRVGKRFMRNRGISSENHNLDFKYDVVIDETADAGIANLISEVRYKKFEISTDLDKVINKIEKSNNPLWGRQVSFHSKKALQACIISIKRRSI